MDVKEALLSSLSGAQGPSDLTEALTGLSRKLDQLIRLADDQVHLQRVSLLEPGHILRFFSADGQHIALSLPEAQDDYMQRVILRTRTFFEAKLLSMIHGMDLVDPASTVCDIGANIGNHTVYFAKMMGVGRLMRIVSFRPVGGWPTKRRSRTTQRNDAVKPAKMTTATRLIHTTAGGSAALSIVGW